VYEETPTPDNLRAPNSTTNLSPSCAVTPELNEVVVMLLLTPPDVLNAVVTPAASPL
jgi:hypothetical protein